MSVFSEYKDTLLNLIEDRDSDDLTFPIKKVGNVLNDYTSGDFIVVGGRKTSGKGYFILNNYVISPLVQKVKAKKAGLNVDIKVIYINTKHNLKQTMDKMVVNYASQQMGGTKISIPSIYGYKGIHAKVDIEGAKNLLSGTFNVFDTLVNKGILNVLTGKRSLLEIGSFITNILEEMGEEVDDEFVRKEKYKKTKIIIVIDDAANIKRDGSTGSNFDVASMIGATFRSVAKKYNAIVVLGVASPSGYKREKVHRSSTADISPYHLYSDRSMILHNPVESDDFKFLGYDIEDFINPSTGINYFRSLFVASNSMGASGIYIPLFLMPENGYFKEMPSIDDLAGIGNLIDKI